MKIRDKILWVVIAFFLVFPAASEAAVAEAAVGDRLDEGKIKIVVGVSAVPHAGIMKVAGEILGREGYNVEIKVFNDYVMPNVALADGSIDANFFAHVPYLIDSIAQMRYDLTWLVRVHVEPMAIYSRRVRSLGGLPNGATVVIPDSVSNRTRALRLLARVGLIKVKDKPNLNISDITENPKDLKIIRTSPYLIPGSLSGADAVVMNGNIAIQSGLHPMLDSIAVEVKDDRYANVLVVRVTDMNKPVIRALAAALNSPEVRGYIENNLAPLGIRASFF
ncbi:lipoprotein [Synergistales bacterium]|nr:lipoprotein [Synergistales bacterium]